MPLRACRAFAAVVTSAFLSLGTVAAHAQTPPIPATPAGDTLRAWLAVMNSGDRSQAEQYVRTIDKDESVDSLVTFHNQTGGFTLVSIESSEPLHLRFLVKEKDGATTALGNLTVKPGQPPTVTTFGLRVLPPGVKIENVTLDPALRARVIDGIETDLTSAYIDPAVAAQMNAALTAHAKAGEYNAITDPDAFCRPAHRRPSRGEPRSASADRLQPFQAAAGGEAQP